MKLPLATALCCCAAHAALDYSTILPALGYGTTIASMTADANGNVYLTGATSNPGFPATPGSLQPKFGDGLCTYGGGGPFSPPVYFSCTDAFVIKLDANGNLVFATFLGGSGQDRATSIGVDGAGNIYVAGISGSWNFPRAPGSAFSGYGPAFVVKLDPTGSTLLYSAFLPGTGTQPFIAPFQSNVPSSMANIVMAVDENGNAWFAANATPGFPVTADALRASGPIVMGELDPTGSQLLYGTYLGGSGYDSVGAIALDSSGNVYLTGSTNSADFPVTPGAMQTTLPKGAADAFVLKLNPSTAALAYSTYLGGGSAPHPSRIRVDAAGDAYVLGSLPGALFPVTAGAFQSAWSPLAAFLTKLTADGAALVYSTFLYFPGAPAQALDVDADGNAYVAGQTNADFPASPNAFQPSFGGGPGDVYIARFAPDGAFAEGTYLGGGSYESAFAIASLPDGSVAVSGVTNSTDFPATSGAGPGYFVARLTISQ